jgi:S1-C subfamily serine protease
MKAKLWLSAAMLFGVALPATADGILSQMENEVATIAQQAKSAVVTIEDSRALLAAYDTSPLERADISNRIAHLQIEKQRQVKRQAEVETQFRAGLVDAATMVQARNQMERLSVQLVAEQRKLDQFGRFSEQQRQLQDIEDALALLSIDRRGAEEALHIQDARYKAGLTTSSDVEDARTNLANIEQDIKAQTTKRDLLQQAALGISKANGALTTGLTDPQRGKETMLWLFQQADANANAPRSGTGFSIGDGFIVTTADVLEDMQNPVVITDAGTQIRARVVAVDVELNVGLVKLAAQADIPSLRLGDSTKVMPGHFAITIGNLHGNNNAIALNLIAGIRSEATDSGKHFYPSLIQIGGTVGAGTSGAPLLNSRGEVIGIMAGVPQAEPEAPTWYYNTYNTLQQPANPRWTLQNVQYAAINSPQWSQYKPEAQGVRKTGANARSGVRRRRVDASAKGQPGKGKRVETDGRRSRLGRNIGYGLNANVKAGPTRMTGPAYAANVVALNSASRMNNFAYNLGTMAYVPVVTAQQTPAVSSAGFAIPISDVQMVLEDMKAGKPVVHAWIGVDLENQERGSEKAGIITILRTVKVKSVYSNAPANRAGVLPGDVLLNLNGQELHTIGDVRTGILKSGLGASLKLTFERSGAPQTVDVKVEARPAMPGAMIVWPPPPPAPPKGVQKTPPK